MWIKLITFLRYDYYSYLNLIVIQEGVVGVDKNLFFAIGVYLINFM